MERATIANPANLSLIEDYYQRWQQDPVLGRAFMAHLF